MAQSQEDYVADQAAVASMAVETMWQRLKDDARGAADVRAWTRQYPWPALGVAVAGGLAAAWLVVPRRRKRHQGPGIAPLGQKRSLRTRVGSAVVGRGLRAATTALQGALVAALTAKIQQAQQAEVGQWPTSPEAHGMGGEE